MDKILMVGEDFQLLATRAAVVSKITKKVTCCNSSEFAHHLGRADFDFVVLCHSLKDDVQASLAAESRRRWPGVRLLQVTVNREQYNTNYEVDAVTSTEPRMLIRCVAQLLSLDTGR